MRKRFSRLYYLIPIVYVGVIAFFLYMQFHSRERFEERLGSIEVSGAYTKALSGGKKIRELVVNCNGVLLRLAGRPIRLTEPPSSQSLGIRALSFSRFDQGLEIAFTAEVRLRFSLQGEQGSIVRLQVALPKNLEGFRILSLPYELKGDKAEQAGGIPLLRLSGGAGVRYAALPAGSTIELRAKLLNLDLAGPDREPLALFARVKEEQDEPYLFWFSRETPLAGAKDYGERLQPYLDRSYRYWNRVLLGAPTGPVIARGLGVCLLSEALKRGEYRRVLPAVTAALRQAQQEASGLPSAFDGSAYIGYLRGHLLRGQEETASLIPRITEAIQRGDPKVFAIPDLMRFIVNRAPFSLAEEALRLADSVDRRKADLGTLLGLLEAYVGAGRCLNDRQVMRQRISELVDAWILPSILQTREGLFLAESAGGQGSRVGLLESVRGGRLLIQAGELGSRASLDILGRNLILGALSQADAEGFLPASLVAAGGRLQSQAGQLSPELLYPLMAEARFLPEDYPLYPDLAPGTWLYTAAVLAQFKTGASRYRFVFSFPAGEAHYFLLQGIAPMKSVVLHEIIWKPDPQYSQYTDGWAYDPESQTLFGKITHRKADEELVLNY
jgi:hypothetical protein